ncbi:hypothetical protein CBS101457_001090 [Exobasidium rhododendri]|nr:hypothetical protein CBS101457_001090 [Exobasidium rhododendri]
MKDTISDANFPRDADGRTYHVGTKPGEVANRIITVGDFSRAYRISKSFDGGKAIFENESQRKFLTLTGRYKGVPITVVAIGMGFSLVDFFIRECRAVVHGDMIVVRIGSCGTMTGTAPIGSVVVPYNSFGVTRNYDHFIREEKGTSPYNVTQFLPCDRAIHDALLNALQGSIPTSSEEVSIFGSQGIQAIGNVTNASTDSFYGSQGRLTTSFLDENDDLIARIHEKHPEAQTFEMETFMLNHLAKAANESQDAKAGRNGVMRVGAAQMVFANRDTLDFITPEQVKVLEEWSGTAVCQALIDVHIPEDRLHGEGVWTRSD